MSKSFFDSQQHPHHPGFCFHRPMHSMTMRHPVLGVLHACLPSSFRVVNDQADWEWRSSSSVISLETDASEGSRSWGFYVDRFKKLRQLLFRELEVLQDWRVFRGRTLLLFLPWASRGHKSEGRVQYCTA
jgi:hypothetical protein